MDVLPETVDELSVPHRAGLAVVDLLVALVPLLNVYKLVKLGLKKNYFSGKCVKITEKIWCWDKPWYEKQHKKGSNRVKYNVALKCGESETLA